MSTMVERDESEQHHTADPSSTPETATSAGAHPGADNTGIAPQTATGTGESDEEAEFREYQQFLRFREWQRRENAGLAPRAETTEESEPAQTDPHRPRTPSRSLRGRWLPRTLSRPLEGLLSWLIRRLILLAVVVLVGYFVLSHYLGSDNSDSGDDGRPAVAPRPPAGAIAVSPSPTTAVSSVYSYIAGDSTTACALFTDAAAHTFATNHGAPDCERAVHQLHQQVTDPNTYPSVGVPGPQALTLTNRKAIIRSCGLNVRGGPRLGAFGLTKRDNGKWIITGHQQESCGP